MVLACGEMNLTNFSQWVCQSVGLLACTTRLLFCCQVDWCRLTYVGYSRSVLEPKTAYGLHHTSVLMLNIQNSGNIDYLHDKELNTSLIIVLIQLDNTILAGSVW